MADPKFIEVDAEARGYPACKGKNCGCTDGMSHSPECRQEHDDACSGVLGRCSVPMWLMGCPAGTCENKAYGVRPPSRVWRSAWTGEKHREDLRYAGYVPGLACPVHGGPEAPNVGIEPPYSINSNDGLGPF
jgi:hypothetical protein